jgi:hypothetical protein
MSPLPLVSVLSMLRILVSPFKTGYTVPDMRYAVPS